jgi:ABC-type sugar transport system ATPase subunit
MPVIRLENVSKEFGRGIIALNDLSLEIGDREILTVVGPSGCGKSTLLRLIAGLDSPTSGRIRMDNVSLETVPPRERNVAMVFQSYALYPHMTCFENLALNLRLKKMPASEIDRRVHETAAMLEITDLLAKKPRQLSGGQRQRVAVGRALIRKPQAFLLDEPLSNLDALLRERVRHELRELFRKVQATVIYVTHDQTEAMTLADRVAVLDRGRLQQVGTPEDLYQKPTNRFVASFIGSPSMNFFETDLANGTFSLAGVSCDTGLQVSRRVTIGIRPEALQPAGPAPTLIARGVGGPADSEEAAKRCTDRTRTVGPTLLKGNVEWVETLGAHSLVNVKFDGTALTALLRSRPAAETIDLSIDPGQIHVFDNETGKNLKFLTSGDTAGS